MFLEPLVAFLRQDRDVWGVHLPGSGGLRVRASVFTDDVTLLLSSETGLQWDWVVLDFFSSATGAKVNMAKSNIMFFGNWGGRMDAPGGFCVEKERLKVLGVWFLRGNMAGYNWGRVFERVRAKLSLWRLRRLSISGKVMAVRLDILPLINHLAVVLPMPFLIGR